MAKKRKKARKRTNKSVPAKGRLRDMADTLWSLAIKRDWNHRCAVCGSRQRMLHAHHIIPRHHGAHRYTLENGICLCPSCHLFNPHLSPHQNAVGWLDWLETWHISRYEWLIDHKRDEFEGVKNADYYCDVIWNLAPFVCPDDWWDVVGVKFGAWLQEQEHE